MRAKLTLKTERRTDSLFKMTESIYENTDVVAHKCNWSCLGPLTFHSGVTGSNVHLSHGSLCAEREGKTFKNGLVFSSRAVKATERICLRVEKEVSNWHGGLRVGFTTVPPSSMYLPLPVMAIPNLTNIPGYWATPVPEDLLMQGSELEFWVSQGGSIYVTVPGNRKHKLVTGVDLSKPLWAMMDIYGNTCSICLLGSKKGTWPGIKTSCPAPEPLIPPVVNTQKLSNSDMRRIGGSEDNISSLTLKFKSVSLGNGELCVVCMGESAGVTLRCGHRCLCANCTPKVLQVFGCCPLCRQKMSAS